VTDRQTELRWLRGAESSGCFARKNCLKCWHTMRTQAWRRFLHSLTAASIMFCSRPIQAVPVASWLHKHPQTSSGRHTAARRSNLV